MSNPYETQFGVKSNHQNGKTWWFDTPEEQATKAGELRSCGFECRHGIYLWTPEKHLQESEKQTGFYKRHGNHWR